MRHPSSSTTRRIRIARGFTYVELLVSITISALLIAGLMGVVNTATKTSEVVGKRNDLSQQARFAMQRMVRTVSHSPLLILPLADNPGTNWPEHIREQTIPASPPIGDSTFASAVLSVSLPHDIDLDRNGIPDVDNDGDGRIDEDGGGDTNRDGAAGIYLIDDNGDGVADNTTVPDPSADNDEDNRGTEDGINGLDDDGDGSIDEDYKSDVNDDGASGILGVDDDADGSIDEAHFNDDDEDGAKDEDWIDTVVFHLSGNALLERLPVPWDQNANASVDGSDFVESVIAENVTRFRVERLATPGRFDRVDLTLELSDPANGESIRLQTVVRVGGAL